MQGTIVDQGNVFDPPEEAVPVFTFAFTPTLEVLYALRETTDDRWKLKDCGAEGGVEIEITGWVDQTSEKEITALLPEPERMDFVSAVARHRTEARDRLSPSERGERFTVPRTDVSYSGRNGIRRCRPFHGIPRLVPARSFGETG